MALLDTQVAMLANLGANYLTTGVAPQRVGNAHQNIVPYQVFEVADGHLILAVGNDSQFAKFCDVAGRAELGARPALRPQRRSRAPSRDAGAAAGGGAEAPRTRATGSRRSRRPRCRAGRSTTSPTCSPTRRCRRAA